MLTLSHASDVALVDLGDREHAVGAPDLEDAVLAHALARPGMDDDHRSCDRRSDVGAREGGFHLVELGPGDRRLGLPLVAERVGDRIAGVEAPEALELAQGPGELHLQTLDPRGELLHRVEGGEELPLFHPVAVVDEELADHGSGTRRSRDPDQPVLGLEAAERRDPVRGRARGCHVGQRGGGGPGGRPLRAAGQPGEGETREERESGPGHEFMPPSSHLRSASRPCS